MTNIDPPKELKWTGERFIPSVEGETAYEHLHRYAFALECAADKVVLDIASGEGYGSYLLSQCAHIAVGMDISTEAVAHASVKYGHQKNLSFCVASCISIPAADNTFDVVVSYETIEHISDHDEMLDEIERVLKPEGVLLVSSPNKKAYSDDANFQNDFHVRELYLEEFKKLLGDRYSHVHFIGQRLILSSHLWPIDYKEYEPTLVHYTGDISYIEKANTPPFEPLYAIAICTNSGAFVNTAVTSLFTKNDDSLFRTYQELTKRVAELENHLAEREKVMQELLKSTSWEITAPIRNIGTFLNSKNYFIRTLFVSCRRQVRLFFETYNSCKQWIKTKNYYIKTLFGSKDKLRKALSAIRAVGLGCFRRQVRIFFKEYEIYQHWMNTNGALQDNLLKRQNVVFANSPKFSLVVPLLAASADYLQALLTAVIKQTYVNWELCIVSGAKCSGAEKTLQAYAADKRIKIYHSIGEHSLALLTNMALDITTGEFIAFIDQDAVLSPVALFDVAKAINDHAGADFVYSDNDLLLDDLRIYPNFKPDWSSDTLRSYNYIDKPYFIKKDLLKEVGHCRSEFEGCHDYDLVLRATEKAIKVVHIPKVLYHARMNGVSYGPSSVKSVCNSVLAQTVLNDHLARLKINRTIEKDKVYDHYKYSYRSDSPMVSIIIPTKDNIVLLRQCLHSIDSCLTYNNYEIIIIENGSVEDATFEYYKQIEKKTNVHILFWHEQFNFSRINNYGAKCSRGELLLFLNNDTQFITPRCLEEMVSLATLTHVGIVGAKLYYPNDTIQHAGIAFNQNGTILHFYRNCPRDFDGYRNKLRRIQNVSAVTGACIMTRRDIFFEVGGFSEDFTVTYSDIDLCFKMTQKGYSVLLTPYAELYHFELQTRGSDDLLKNVLIAQKDRSIFVKKWQFFYQKGDPFYSPNLEQNDESYSFYTIAGECVSKQES